MKKDFKQFIRRVIIVFTVIMAGIITGCMGISDPMVKEKVSKDKNCPVDQVRILDRDHADGICTFKLEACGSKYDYHMAPMIFEKGKEPSGISRFKEN